MQILLDLSRLGECSTPNHQKINQHSQIWRQAGYRENIMQAFFHHVTNATTLQQQESAVAKQFCVQSAKGNGRWHHNPRKKTCKCPDTCRSTVRFETVFNFSYKISHVNSHRRETNHSPFQRLWRSPGKFCAPLSWSSWEHQWMIVGTAQSTAKVYSMNDNFQISGRESDFYIRLFAQNESRIALRNHTICCEWQANCWSAQSLTPHLGFPRNC